MTTLHNICFHHEFSAPQKRAPAAIQLNHSRGPHRAQIGPTAGTIAAGVYPEPLFLGLLTKLPASDGAHLIELDAPGYARQVISLAPRDATYFCVPRPILFEVHRMPAIAGFGLFDQMMGGSICGYGALHPGNLSREPVERIEVMSHQLLIKRCRRAGPGLL